MPDREARREENQKVFRRANERLRERVQEYGVADSIPFLCECADAGCLGRVELSAADYGYVRAEPNRFVILPGHRLTEGERVVDDKSEFQIVEKSSS